MFALDRCSDVAETAGASGFKGIDQRPVTLDPAGGGLLIESVEITKELVLDPQQLTPAGGEVASTLKTEGVGARGSVKRFSSRCAPIDHDGLLGAIPHSDTTDVQGIAEAVCVVIDAAEYQRGITDVELRQSIDHVFGEGFAFEARLVGSTCTNFKVGGELAGQSPSLFERGVRPIEIGLFGFEFGVDRRPSGRGFGPILGTSMISTSASAPEARIHDPLGRVWVYKFCDAVACVGDVSP